MRLEDGPPARGEHSGEGKLDRKHDGDLNGDDGEKMKPVFFIGKSRALPTLGFKILLRHEHRAPRAGGDVIARVQHVAAAPDFLAQHDAALGGFDVIKPRGDDEAHEVQRRLHDDAFGAREGIRGISEKRTEKHVGSHVQLDPPHDELVKLNHAPPQGKSDGGDGLGCGVPHSHGKRGSLGLHFLLLLCMLLLA